MTEPVDTMTPAPPSTANRRYVTPILTGLLIVAAGLLPWTLLARVDAEVRPDLPWAALVTVAYLGILLAWLNGWGPPRRSVDRRRQRLRLWSRTVPEADGLSAGVVMVLLGLLYALWITISRMSPTPDLSAYPTTSYRWSLFIMGGVTAGLVEEAAFRGTCRPVSNRMTARTPSGSPVWYLSHRTSHKD